MWGVGGNRVVERPTWFVEETPELILHIRLPLLQVLLLRPRSTGQHIIIIIIIIIIILSFQTSQNTSLKKAFVHVHLLIQIIHLGQSDKE